jgi:hypothetical protein
MQILQIRINRRIALRLPQFAPFAAPCFKAGSSKLKVVNFQKNHAVKRLNAPQLRLAKKLSTSI